MEAVEYRVMYDLETEFWWYRSLHDILVGTLRDYGIKSGEDLLDAGCGTGGFMRRLSALSSEVYGFDLSAEAARFWSERGTAPASCLASINELPYASNRFGAVVSIDILECEGVRDRDAYAELVRVTRPGGLILVVVPAYEWMMTEGHHKAVHAVRRYNKGSVRALAEGLPVHIERVTHAFAALFPAVAGTRLYNRWQERRGPVEVKSELQPLAPPVNKLLHGITSVERQLLRLVDMPFGSSLIMVARKGTSQ